MLKNVAGNEASLDYENNAATTVNADGTSRNVKEPYVMASFASFDTEHPKIIKVNNDKGMNQDGSFVAVVLAMPGLTQSPQLDNMVDLPESVTFLPCIRVACLSFAATQSRDKWLPITEPGLYAHSHFNAVPLGGISFSKHPALSPNTSLITQARYHSMMPASGPVPKAAQRCTRALHPSALPKSPAAPPGPPCSRAGPRFIPLRRSRLSWEPKNRKTP